VGALVTLELPDDSPVRQLPWIITFGPLSDDEDWEPVVCGLYEPAHALALAEEVVADDEVMAVVEPVMSFVTPAEIRAEIAVARAEARNRAANQADLDEEAEAAAAYPDDYHVDELHAAIHDDHSLGSLPDPAEVRAGMARVAARFAGSVG
jgi:hypothetical protein